MNYEALQIRIEEIAQNVVSSTRIVKPVLKINRRVAFLLSTVGQKSQNMVVTHPATPLFFVTHPPKINELDTVVTTPLSSDPDHPLKI